jgi:cellobiose transport system substrate-binding protein
MTVTRGRLRRTAAVALALVTAAGVTTACSKSDDGGTANGKTKLVVQTFGQFGYEQAVKDYEAANPDIDVDLQKLGELRDFQPRLVQWLGAGKGAGDVVALEEGVLLGYIQQPDNFVNLFDYGGEELKDNFLSWKWERGITPDGKKLVGLGTDVGGLALCYRRDLFQKAGLPVERAEVAKLLPTWDAYKQVGEQFKAKDVGAAWNDSATGVVQPLAMQSSDKIFFDEDNSFIGDTNPSVKQTWDYAMGLIDAGLTAKLTTWSEDWSAGFKKGSFATMPCPAWMTGIIKTNAGDGAKGLWDVATVPGGSGNWGGSYLAVPEQSRHPKEAYELAKFLTSKEGQLAAYKAVGAMPSSPQGLDDPAFKDSSNDYFNNAPTGQIFGESARNLKPVFLGAKHQDIWENVFMPQMQAVEQGKSSPEKAWQAAVAEAKKRSSQ